MRAEARDEMAENPPETNLDLQDCSEEDWNKFRQDQNMRLMEAAETRAESIPSSSVMGSSSTMQCLDTVTGTAVSLRTVTGTSGTLMSRRSTTAKSDWDHLDLQKLFNFHQPSPDAWKVPIIECKDKILDMVGGKLDDKTRNQLVLTLIFPGNQIVILSGPTGCGKSTQVPQYILDQHAMERRNVNIVVTQPRKLAASSLARRVCEERGWELGGLVGYQVGLDKANKSQDTRLLYVTTGVLKRMIIGKKNLNTWTHIVLDEVHERNEDMDLLLMMCKKFLFTNSKNTKVIRS